MDTVVTMSTLALETKLRILREKSNTLSASLTQKLASSRSGQNLLHIGSSLSSLPPDLHLLLQELHPMLHESETLKVDLEKKLQTVAKRGMEIRESQMRIENAAECAELYEDLVSAERHVNVATKEHEEEWEEKEGEQATCGVFCVI